MRASPMTSVESLIREMPNKPWMYFGCTSGPGHRLQTAGGRTPDFPFEIRKHFEYMDAKLCWKETTEGVVKLTRLNNVGYSAMAFWDYSIDSRGGSNSIFFAPNTSITAEILWTDAQIKFPAITKRFKPLDFSRVGEC
jgi:hypothetical protein